MSKIAQKANQNEVSLDYADFKEIVWSDHQLPNIVLHVIEQLSDVNLKVQAKKKIRQIAKDKLKKEFDATFKQAKDAFRRNAGLGPDDEVPLDENEHFVRFKQQYLNEEELRVQDVRITMEEKEFD